jgi:hypothetical protein
VDNFGLSLSNVSNKRIRHLQGKIPQNAAVLVSALFLLIPAIYNGYPLVNPDTATYLASGFKPETPFDRPITYGLLLRLFSLNGASLWLVVYAQALLVTTLIFRILKRLMDGGAYLLKGVLTLLFLSLFTGLSWVVCQVQPDIFTPIAFLCIILLLMGREGTAGKIVLYLLFFISVAVHLSHPLLLAGVVLLLWFVRRVYAAGDRKQKGVATITLILLCAASMLVMGSAFSKSRHVYFMGSLLEKGVLHTYLQDNCATHDFRICAYKHVLGNSSDHFIWESDSPLYKIGDWKGTKPEFNMIIHDVLTTPKYLWLFITASFREALRQAVTFRIGDGNDIFPIGSNVEQRIIAYFPHEAAMFHAARQNESDIGSAFYLPNRLFAFLVILSVVVIGYGVLKWNGLSGQLKVVVFVGITGVLLNCLDCATLSVVNGRYGCKMIWLLPFAAACMLLSKKSGENPANSSNLT